PRLIDLEQPIEHPRYQPPQLRKRQRRRPDFSPAWPPASGTRLPPATAPDDDANPPRCVPGSPQGPLRSYHPSSTVRSDDPPGTPARTPATIPPYHLRQQVVVLPAPVFLGGAKYHPRFRHVRHFAFGPGLHQGPSPLNEQRP